MPKGDNFKKGGKNYITSEEARKRGKKGGKVGGLAEVPKGFAHVDVQVKAQLTRKINIEVGNDKEQEATEKKAEA